MILTRKQKQKIKKILFVTSCIFAIQLGIPHVSLAAQENYLSVSKGEQPKYKHSVVGVETTTPSLVEIIDRDERFEPYPEEAVPTKGFPEIKDTHVVKEHWLTVTAYSSTPDQTDSTPYTTGWITPVRDGVVALNFLPKGTLVRFPDLYGEKIFVVEDAMNVRYTYRADIWMYEREQAKQFGIKYTRMEELGAQVSRQYVLNHFEAAFPGLK